MSKRMKAAKEKRKTYEGAPCQDCGGTERLTKTGRCADKVCHKAKVSEYNRKHRTKMNDLLKS